MSKNRILCVIPARLHSTRLPRKPLVQIGDKPLIQWTYEAAKKSDLFDDVIVATDAVEIQSLIAGLGGHVAMTPPELPTGTDRVAYVAEQHPQADVIVNLQGDEPFVKPDMLAALVAPYQAGSVPMATLACPLQFETEYADPNTVKVIYNKNHQALYFSRAPIPFFRQKHDNVPVAMHLGLYAFTRSFLLEFTKMEQTPLEQIELLEQLRALENGIPIHVSLTPHRIIEVNYPEDLEKARRYAAGL